MGYRGSKTLPGPVGRGAFPPSQRLDVISLASSTPGPQDCPATRWALDDLAAALVNRAAHDLAMSRSTIWRTLDQADLKPHRSVYWLNSHDPDFDAKARAICRLYLEAPPRPGLMLGFTGFRPEQLKEPAERLAALIASC